MSYAYKIQGSVDEYTNFVIEGMIGVYGRSRSDVVATIIRFWIQDNTEQLKENGLSVADWKSRMSHRA